MSKLKLDDIQEILSQDGWKLISDTYTNLKTEMEYECPEGHRVFAPWEKMRARRECPVCKANSFANITREVRTKPVGVYRVLALDQASHTTGYAIFDNGALIKYGKFDTNANDEVKRFSEVKQWMLSMISIWRPDYIGFEGIQFQEEGGGKAMGVTVFQTLARLQGVLMEACYAIGVPFEVCPTNTWRHACGVKGRSRADKKRSMQLLVKEWYDVTVTDDESDAIGIGRYLTKYVDKNLKTENWEI